MLTARSCASTEVGTSLGTTWKSAVPGAGGPLHGPPEPGRGLRRLDAGQVHNAGHPGDAGHRLETLAVSVQPLQVRRLERPRVPAPRGEDVDRRQRRHVEARLQDVVALP